MAVTTFWQLEELGRTRLSKHFFFRDFLHSEIANFYQMRNVPSDTELAIYAGSKLCEEVLEPIVEQFGPIQIRSGYRSAELNAFGASRRLKCASNEKNSAYHIWDRRDAGGHCGAAACIVVPSVLDGPSGRCEWQWLADWIDMKLPYHRVTFFKHQLAFNIGWHELPRREIYSYLEPQGWYVKPGRRSSARTNEQLSLDISLDAKTSEQSRLSELL